MATQSVENPRFSFGKTVTDMFRTIGGNWMALCGLALLLAGVPNAIYSAFAFQSFGALALGQTAMSGNWLQNFALTFFLGWIVVAILSVFCQAAMTSLSLRSLTGEERGFGIALRDGLRFFLPVLAIVIIYYVAIIVIVAIPVALIFGAAFGGGTGAVGAAFGAFILMLLVVLPLLIFVAAVWLSAVPAAIQERLGPIDSLLRSWDLSAGHRWKLVAMVLIYGFAIMIISSAISSVTMPFMMMGDLGQPGNPGEVFSRMMPLMVIQSFLGSLTLVVTHPAVAATYVNLRTAKEGMFTETVADIFE